MESDVTPYCEVTSLVSSEEQSRNGERGAGCALVGTPQARKAGQTSGKTHSPYKPAAGE